MGADQILVGAVLPPDEGGGDLSGSGAHEDRPGQGDDAPAAVGSGPAIGVVGQQRNALPINRDVHILDAGVRSRGEGHPEGVLGVGREYMVHHQPAAGAVGRALDPVPGMLREVLGVRVGVIHRLSAALADGEAADRARRVQIAFEQRRRERLRLRDVVEVVAHLIERQPVSGIHFEVQQLEDGLLVLRAVQALERTVSGVGVSGGGLVEAVFEGLHQGQQRFAAPSPGARRGHHSRAQLPDHLLGHIGVLRRVGHVEGLERHVARHQPIVVAHDAGAAHHPVGQGVVRFRLRGCGRGFRRRRPERRPGEYGQSVERALGSLKIH